MAPLLLVSLYLEDAGGAVSSTSGVTMAVHFFLGIGGVPSVTCALSWGWVCLLPCVCVLIWGGTFCSWVCTLTGMSGGVQYCFWQLTTAAPSILEWSSPAQPPGH